MQPMCRKLNAVFRQSELSGSDRMVSQRWEALLAEAHPRRVKSHRPIPDKIIYTDVATETMILANVVSDKR